jgi:hypothetical protein
MADPEPLADELAADLERIKQRDVEPETVPEPAAVSEQAPDSVQGAEEAMELEPEAPPDTEPTPLDMSPTQKVSDDLGALFAALRGGEADAQPASPPEIGPDEHQVAPEAEPQAPTRAPSPPTAGEHTGWMEERDTRLLPITNRALRGVKKSVTEAQNIALDSLRTDEDWKPDGGLLAENLRADLIGLWAESYSAGHAVAEEMTGSRLKRLDTPHSDAADGFGSALASALVGALGGAGEGLRDRQSAASRVFRGWRTDEAERRIRELAFRGYHLGVIDSVKDEAELEWVSSGVPCSACREAASDPSANVPPIHAGCGCTLVATS